MKFFNSKNEECFMKDIVKDLMTEDLDFVQASESANGDRLTLLFIGGVCEYTLDIVSDSNGESCVKVTKLPPFISLDQ